MKVTKCRICKSESLHEILDLGITPLANNFLRKEQLNSPEPTVPLVVLFCVDCGLVQLSHVVPPEMMFRNYLYTSSMSKTLTEHFVQLVKEAIEKSKLTEDSLVVDIGSNDGTLLKAFKAYKIKTLGVEPATNIAKLAESNGIETFNDFFSYQTASKIVKEKGNAKIITATNVFAHVYDLDDFIKGIDVLMEDEGIFIIEVPYLVDLLEKTEFDTIYHEHLSHFAIRPLVTFFKRFDMEIVDIKRISIHGGSVRIFVKKASDLNSISRSVAKLLELEQALKFDSVETYLKFAAEVKLAKERLLALLRELKSEGKRIIGYGASAKGNTLLNYCGIGTDILEYIVDNIPFKQGLYTPGMHIKVFPEERIMRDKPDYALILAWNFAEEIIKKQQRYRDLGGHFIIPIPTLKII